MIKRLLIFLLLCVTPLIAADETLLPNSDNANDGNTSCDTNAFADLDEDPADANPCGSGSTCTGWCTADSNNVNWVFMFTMQDPAAALDTTTDAQVIRFYVQSYDEGQGGVPDIQVNIYDTTTTPCDTLHESGTVVALTDAGFPNEVSELWTAAGLSAGADVCVQVDCSKSGGSPGNRNSCVIDNVVWDATHTAVTGRTRRVF